MAIYQGDTKISGAGVAIDSALSDSSTNPVQNQAVTNALEDVGYSTWQKPADWVDIRSGALDNSVYMLVGHSADYSLYPELVVRGQVSTSSNTYDVYVDGEKVATTASGTETTLNWQTLALETGFDVSYPINLRTHVVRITPTVTTDTLSGVSIVAASASVPRGVLWFHYELSNQINIRNAFQRCPYLEAVTAKDDVIKLYDNGSVNYGIAYFIRSSGILAPRGVLHLPVLEGTNSTSGVNTYSAFAAAKVSECVIRYRNCIILSSADIDYGWTAKEVQTENAQVGFGAVMRGPSITKFPPLYIGGTSALPGPVTNLPNLEPTILDLSANTSVERLRINGTSTVRMDGLKGLIVPKEAPYTGSSPQINVSYTGLDRQALRQMFRSMPTVSDGQVCNITGTTGADDLTAEDLAIATSRGWTIIR